MLYSSFRALYCMKWLKNTQIIRIIFRYSNIRIMSFKFWILFVIRFGNFLPTNIIRLFDSLQNDYSWQHWPCLGTCRAQFLNPGTEGVNAVSIAQMRWHFVCDLIWTVSHGFYGKPIVKIHKNYRSNGNHKVTHYQILLTMF